MCFNFSCCCHVHASHRIASHRRERMLFWLVVVVVVRPAQSNRHQGVPSTAAAPPQARQPIRAAHPPSLLPFLLEARSQRRLALDNCQTSCRPGSLLLLGKPSLPARWLSFLCTSPPESTPASASLHEVGILAFFCCISTWYLLHHRHHHSKLHCLFVVHSF